MKLVVFIQVALLFVQLVRSGKVEDESPGSCKSTLERCINTDCFGNNTVLEEIKQELCDIQDTECTDNPCKNGGTCINVTDTPVCQCPPEYVGKVCELNCTVEYEKLNAELGTFLNPETVITNSIEECDSACTGNCTDYIFRGSDCSLFRAPVFSATFGPGTIEDAEGFCEAICTSQMNSCRFYAKFFICYTFSVSVTDLPVTSTGLIDPVFNKIAKCDISP